MRVDPTYQRLEDLEGILHDNLRASSWADETNPIYDRVAASEVQNFIEDSEVTYESISTDENEAKTEAASTALGDSDAKESNKKINIYGDMDEDVFKKGVETPKTKNRPTKTVGFGGTEVYQDPSTQFKNSKDDMGEGIYQDPSETLHGKNAGMDDMGDNIYQDPTTTIETRKPTDPFGDDDVYLDPTTVQSTKKPDDGFGENFIYKDPEKTNISEEDPYEDLSSIQTAVKENKGRKKNQKTIILQTHCIHHLPSHL